jgi:tellurite resistance protein TerC
MTPAPPAFARGSPTLPRHDRPTGPTGGLPSTDISLVSARMIWFWIGFLLLVCFFLALDLGVFHRKEHSVSMREALTWSAVWIVTSLLFSGFVYYIYEHDWEQIRTNSAGVKSGFDAWTTYMSAYVLEWSLSVDNLFVIALIFTYFRIPSQYQHRVLFWGILGAIVMRGIFIGLGTTLLTYLHWLIYVFGAFLLFTAWKMLSADEDPDPAKSRVVQFINRNFPVVNELDGRKFITTRPDPVSGVMKKFITPLGMALIVVEATDLIFAVDSIPAALGLTRETFIIYTSNVFAILGLRSMYFALAGLMGKFHYLKISLAVILGFIGLKMIFEHFIKQVDFLKNNLAVITLSVIFMTLGAGVIASLLHARKHPTPPAEPEQPHA